MKARAGLRPWSVAIVRMRYMGGRRRGDGPTELLGRWELKPIPRVGDAAGVKIVASADQLREAGGLQVSEISNSYTEAMLMGRSSEGEVIPPDEIVFYEITWIKPDGTCGETRRFHIDGVPGYVPESAQWTVSLVRGHDDRDRTGVLR